MSETPTRATFYDKVILAPGSMELLLTIPATIKKGNDLLKGTILGRITASGLYVAYDDSASDGSEVASGILMESVNASSTAPGATTGISPAENRDVPAPMAVKGQFLLDQLTGYDAAAGADMGATEIPGRNILKL